MPEKYFKHYPTIDFDVKNDGNLIQAKDIFRNIRISSDGLNTTTGYEFYQIGQQDRPDITASKIYGDATLYWLFWMVNDHLAVHSDWPMSFSVLEKYINRKYSGKCLVGSASTDVVSSSDSKFLQGEKVIGSTSSAFGYVTKVDPTNNQIVLNDIEGNFTLNETVTGSQSSKSFTLSSVRDFKDSPHHYENSEGLKTSVSTGNTLVSNHDYEVDFNENKRTIRYIKAEYVEQLLREFKSMIKE